VGWRIRRVKRALGRKRPAPTPVRLVHFAPNYTGNPYQRMLYAGLPAINARAVPVKDITEHLVTEAASEGVEMQCPAVAKYGVNPPLAELSSVPVQKAEPPVEVVNAMRATARPASASAGSVEARQTKFTWQG
jgi:hypothetical protein